MRQVRDKGETEEKYMIDMLATGDRGGTEECQNSDRGGVRGKTIERRMRDRGELKEGQRRGNGKTVEWHM